MQYEGAEVPSVSLAAGFTVITVPAASVDQARKVAEAAMYRAKQATKGRSPRLSSLTVEGDDTVQMIELDGNHAS